MQAETLRIFYRGYELRIYVGVNPATNANGMFKVFLNGDEAHSDYLRDSTIFSEALATEALRRAAVEFIDQKLGGAATPAP